MRAPAGISGFVEYPGSRPGRAERKLFRRYGRLPPLKRPSAWRRLRMAIGRVLRLLRLRPPPPPEPWRPSLTHAGRDDQKPLIVWAFGIDRDTLRTACEHLRNLQPSLPGYAPVLVTDVADFAFFSRLGWLVEFVPELAAPAVAYGERKRRYLAWRYRDAPALPASALLDRTLRPEDLLIG